MGKSNKYHNIHEFHNFHNKSYKITSIKLQILTNWTISQGKIEINDYLPETRFEFSSAYGLPIETWCLLSKG